jgi:hypothetical protein
MVVVPQFPLDERLLPHGEDADCDDVNCSFWEVDLTTGSTITIPEGDAAERFPDFVIIHLLAKHTFSMV